MRPFLLPDEPDASMPSHALACRFIDRLHALERHGAGEVEAMTGLFSDDSDMTSPALRQAGAQRSGRDGVRAFWSEYCAALPSARTEFLQVTLGERSVGLFWTTRTGPPSDGTAVEYHGSTLLEHDDAGRIVRFEAYFDPRDLDAETHRAG